MNFFQSFKLALQSIMKSKVRAFLTMLGIIIGVGAVTVIVGMGNGMQNYISDSFESMGTNLITVSIQGRGTSRSVDVDDMYALVSDNPDVLGYVSPTVSVSGSVKIGSEEMDSTSVSGVGEDYCTIKKYSISDGRFLQYVDILRRQKVCVIGSYLSTTYYGGNAVGQTLKLNGNTYTIVGVLTEEDDSTSGSTDDAVYIPYSNAAKMSWTGKISSFSFSAAAENTVDQAVTLIEDALYKVYESDDYYTVISMSQMLDSFTDIVNVVVVVLGAIAAISLVVGGIGIMNIMLVSVTERTREIGIRKSLGAKQKDIMQQFVIEAATTSALGGVIGIILGYLLSSFATKIIVTLMDTDITVAPSTGAVIGAFSVSVAIGIIFGYLPARKAARLNPSDARRYD
ncbi:MAG: ABC transporter permease [Oscillospiraceae bacterium]|nr:ABC transporter permease [Oscillospiraceae bacterium]